MGSVRVCGIYRIIHVASGREYIGSSADIDHRWKEHRYRLGRGSHHSRYLQRVWNKDGEGAFLFEIIEVVNLDSLLAVEQRYLDIRHPVFNWSPTAGSRRGATTPPETREKQRQSKLGKPLTNAHRKTLSDVRRGVNKPKSVEAMVNATRGIPKSEEHRAKLSAASSSYRFREPEKHAAAVAKRTVTLRLRALERRLAKERATSVTQQSLFGPETDS